ncbi:YraN family protein [Persephonella sp.]
MSNKKDIGRENEEKAVNFLKNLGYKILHRNFHSKFGEIDIIAEDGKEIVIIEVRSKRYEIFGSPEETVNRSKIKKIIKTTEYYLMKNNLTNRQIRFDIISIVNNNISHIKNAFDLS